MTLSRRALIGGGGCLAAALACPAVLRAGSALVEIAMRGRDGATVWFDPVGLHVEPGTTLRWVNRDAGNSHTATAYDPAIGERQRRIPAGAAPWDSGYLLPNEDFSVVLTAEGIYDYYCLPHEMAGMVGRIVVGRVSAEPAFPGAGEPPPEVALAAFPPVARILAEGAIGPGT